MALVNVEPVYSPSELRAPVRFLESVVECLSSASSALVAAAAASRRAMLSAPDVLPPPAPGPASLSLTAASRRPYSVCFTFSANLLRTILHQPWRHTQWCRCVEKLGGGVAVSQVKPSNCFRRSEKLVLPSILAYVFHPSGCETCTVIKQQF